MATRNHKSYKLKDDTLEHTAREFPQSSSRLFRAKQEVEAAKKREEAIAKETEDKKAKLIQLLTHAHKSVIIDRVKYSVVNGELHREIIYD